MIYISPVHFLYPLAGGRLSRLPCMGNHTTFMLSIGSSSIGGFIISTWGRASNHTTFELELYELTYTTIGYFSFMERMVFRLEY